MSADPHAHAHDTTLIGESRPSRVVGASATRVQGRNASLPGVSEAGLVERELERYQVMRPLGAGGMGEVALVRDHDIDRTVAVKFLHSELADPPSVARFVDEIRTVGQLEHPNIVPIHDAGRDQAGRYFFVMKHVEGETLETIIDKLREGEPSYVERYTFNERAEIFIGVLNALKFAHEKGFLHRDVKPANVMVGRAGEVVLMDWGLSKSLQADSQEPAPFVVAKEAASKNSTARLVHTMAGSVMGTPLYMSPEQTRGDPLDVRSDLYSAAVVLRELMYLEHYLAGREALEDVLLGVQTVVQTSMLSDGGRPPVPAPYAHVIAKGMAKDPAKRFQTADEFIAVLRRVQEGGAPVQCPVTLTRRMATGYARFVDRKPWLGVGVAWIGLAVFVAGVASLVARLL